MTSGCLLSCNHLYVFQHYLDSRHRSTEFNSQTCNILNFHSNVKWSILDFFKTIKHCSNTKSLHSKAKHTQIYTKVNCMKKFQALRPQFAVVAWGRRADSLGWYFRESLVFLAREMGVGWERGLRSEWMKENFFSLLRRIPYSPRWT